jgi:transcriptional regulator with XRE-family HTH domain
MKKKEEVKDKTRNNRFVEAFDYLVRNTDLTTRIQLAKKMGVSKDTITRIMHAYTPVTEDAITKFQTATNCIFNIQWLRGESDTMMAIGIEKKTAHAEELPHQSTQMPDYSSMTNAIIAAKDDAIESLKRELAGKEESAAKAEESAMRELAAKDETISALRSELATKSAYVESLKQQVADSRQLIADLRAELASQQAKDAFGNYPFTIGAADDGNRPHHEK